MLALMFKNSFSRITSRGQLFFNYLMIYYWCIVQNLGTNYFLIVGVMQM